MLVASSLQLYRLIARKSDLDFQLLQITNARMRITSILDRLFTNQPDLDPNNAAVIAQEQLQERVQRQEKNMDALTTKIQQEKASIEEQINGLRKNISQGIKNAFGANPFQSQGG
jgi:hypothetical protein